MMPNYFVLAFMGISIFILTLISLRLNLKQSKLIEEIGSELTETNLTLHGLRERVVDMETAHNNLRHAQNDLKFAFEKLRLTESGKTEDVTVVNLKNTTFMASTKLKELAAKYPHYYADVSGLEYIDFYRLMDIYDIRDATVQHSIKKLLAAGERGAKDYRKDIQEVIDTLTRRLDMLDENGVE